MRKGGVQALQEFIFREALIHLQIQAYIATHGQSAGVIQNAIQGFSMQAEPILGSIEKKLEQDDAASSTIGAASLGGENAKSTHGGKVPTLGGSDAGGPPPLPRWGEDGDEVDVSTALRPRKGGGKRLGVPD